MCKLKQHTKHMVVSLLFELEGSSILRGVRNTPAHHTANSE